MISLVRFIKIFKEAGLFVAIVNFLNAIFSRFLGFQIQRSLVKNKNAISRNIFNNKVLKESNKGYISVDPMPTEDELNTYYKNFYWQSPSARHYGVEIRDIIHYDMLRKLIPDFFHGEKVIANFGAGHGGASYLFWYDGFHVINIDLSEMPKSFNSRWTHNLSTNELNDSSVDLIYGSHSLEHVQDISTFKSEVRRILKPGGKLFFEVPNAEHYLNGAMNNNIDIPHTYYFKKSFFNSWFDEVLLNETFDESIYKSSNFVEKWVNTKIKNGVVIRALGKIN